MGNLKLKDFVDEESLKKLQELRSTISDVRQDYKDAASELIKGLTVDVKVKGDIDKLQAIYNTQAKNVSSASEKLTDAFSRQAEVAEQLMKKIKEKADAEKLSTKEVKELSKASAEASKAMQQAAKAEEAMNKAQKSANTTRKAAAMTEEERIRFIKESLELADKEVHSIEEANDVNKKLRQAVKMVRDTDEDYKNTLGKLNSTIGVNTDYVKRNSDRYTQQKMEIGNYKENIKAAWMEIERGNSSMKNMGIIASNVGNILRRNFSKGISNVGVGVASMVKGFVGAQAVLTGVQKLISLFKGGIQTSIEFEAANSNLAAVLGTTSDKIKDLQNDARELGASTKYTAAEATNLQIELAKLGFTAQEIKDSTQYILRFAQATGAELPDAASLAGAALRMFGASTKETERYVSAMAVSTSRSALSFSYLATAMPIVGPVAKSFNFTIEDTLALLGKLSDAGFDASMAATATRNILLNLADSNGKLAKTLGEPVKTLPDLVNGLVKLRDNGVDLNTTLELTDKRSVSAFNAFLTSADKIVPLREQITGVEGELQSMADVMSDNMAGSLKSLSSAWDELMLTINGSNGWMRSVVDWVTGMVRGLSALLASVETIETKMMSGYEKSYMKITKSADIIGKYEEQIARDTEKYVKQGMSAKEAEEKARDIQLKSLEERIKKEEVLIADAEAKKKEIQDKETWYNKAYLHKMEDGSYKTYAAMELQQSEAIAKSKAMISVYRSLSSEIKNVSGASTTGGNGVKIETDKEKAARLKVEADLQRSQTALMEEGLDKELATIRYGYQQKIDAVKGNSSAEMALRKSLLQEMNNALSKASEEYEKNRASIDLQNRLASVEEGSDEEMSIRLDILEKQKEEEIKAAESNGADVSLIEQKYLNERRKIYEEYAADYVDEISKSAAAEQVVRNAQYNSDLKELEKLHAKKLISDEEYEKKKADITERYSIDTAKAAISSLEEQLAVEELNDDKREEIAERLQKAKADLAKAEADAEINELERIKKKEEDMEDERNERIQKSINIAMDALSTVADFASTMYQRDIEELEKQQEANEEAYNADVERIEALAESGAISEEEAEARKRAAEAETSRKNEELEKKKVQLQQKQAKWDKAVQIAQTGIATARGIMEAWQLGPVLGAVMAAVVAAMGAVQVATIAATPIPAYKEGTKNGGHIGGLAIVGDGGKHEVVVYGSKSWVTPDVPTVVDLPKGAEVFPDINEFVGNVRMNPIYDSGISSPVVVNDYSELSREMKGMRVELRKIMKIIHKEAYNSNYEHYKSTIL